MNSQFFSQHPIIDFFKFELREQLPGWRINGLGVRTREYFADDSDWNVKFTPTAKPEFDESYFEWVDVLTAVRNAQNHFRMIEVGAGYGPRLVMAAVALKQISQIPFQLIGIEADPNRFKWMQQNFLDNGISLSDHRFYQGVVNASGKSVWFGVGDSAKSYGACILEGKNIPRLFSHGLRGWLKFQIHRNRLRKCGANRPELVKGYRLSKIIKKYSKIDLVDMDIQGAEEEVIIESISEMNKSVKMIHIGTHSESIEDNLHKLFLSHGWENVWNFKKASSQSTPYGNIRFSDGVQTWINVKL